MTCSHLVSPHRASSALVSAIPALIASFRPAGKRSAPDASTHARASDQHRKKEGVFNYRLAHARWRYHQPGTSCGSFFGSIITVVMTTWVMGGRWTPVAVRAINTRIDGVPPGSGSARLTCGFCRFRGRPRRAAGLATGLRVRGLFCLVRVLVWVSARVQAAQYPFSTDSPL